MKKEITDWFDEPPNVIDFWQENKPKLTQAEIKKAAEVFKSFVDPYNQGSLYWTIKSKFHKETFNKFWKLSHKYNKNPVNHPYSVDQYIVDKGLGKKKCNNCGSCSCN